MIHSSTFMNVLLGENLINCSPFRESQINYDGEVIAEQLVHCFLKSLPLTISKGRVVRTDCFVSVFSPIKRSEGGIGFKTESN